MLLDVLRSIAGGEVGAARLGVGSDIQGGDVVADGLKQRASLRRVDIFGTAAPVSCDHHGETVRFRVGRGAQQNRVQDAENRGIHPDAEGERANHDQGEGGALAKLPEGEAGVGPECHAS